MGTEDFTPYLIGTGEAYSALDAVRAAHHLPQLSLSSQTVVGGHSQGGNAALWTGKLAGSYAPELKIDGVAALAPATDLVTLAKTVQGTAGGTVISAYAISAYSDTYNNGRFDDYVRPAARVQVTEAAKRCLAKPGIAASVIIAGAKPRSIFGTDFASGPLGNRLRQNTPTADISAPLLVASGTGDEVIRVTINEAWVRQQCAAAHKLDFRTYPDLTHMGLMDAKSPLTKQLTAWTADRIAGKPAPHTC